MDTFLINLQQNPYLLYTTVSLFSLCVGSFLNVVIHRLPIMLNNEWTELSEDFLKIKPKKERKGFNLWFPRSHCPACKKQLAFYHNIPLISYLYQKGRCAFCEKSIAWRYPLIELATAFLSVLIVIHYGLTIKTVFALLFTYILLVLAMIDIDTQLLPDNLTIGLLWLGLIANSQALFTSLNNAVLSAAACYVLLWLFLKLFTLITKKDGMGLGDVKLFAALGAWLGWQMMPLILLLSSLLGCVIGISVLKIRGQDKNTALAFGQYLCFAGFVALFFGETILQWYLSLIIL